MRKVKFICAQPANLYYAWQVEVLINNFTKLGVDPNDMNIVCATDDKSIPNEWLKLMNQYSSVKFFFYTDTRENKNYISSIRPNILKQHFKKHSNLKNDVIFYHDCDILFTKNPSEWITTEMLEDDNWYGSDVRWYIGHEYIISKGEDVLNKMSDIMEIETSVVKDNELNCIGAQYLMKGLDFEFWDWVEKKSDKLFKEINDLNNHKLTLDRHTHSPNSPTRELYNPLQIWCADMWAVLWKGWLMGKTTIPHSNFDFSWGTSFKEDYFKMNIMHNAGVTSELARDEKLFLKSNYINKLPYNEDLEINSKFASYYYWNEVTDVSKKSALL